MATAQRMVNDSSEFVRAFFAIEINYLSPLLGREATVQHILPMLLLLLRDDTSEVSCLHFC
jgi:serine/threonine-protein phosphatase 2A regulatory subunit A